MTRKGQGILEMTFVIILMTLMIGGILNIWFWANNRIVARQRQYNASRVVAGTSSDTYQLLLPNYTQANLTEEQVLLDAPKLK